MAPAAPVPAGTSQHHRLQRPRDGRGQLRQRKRFAQQLVFADDFFDGFHVGVAGGDDHGEFGGLDADFLHQFGARHAGHEVVGDEEVGQVFAQHGQGRFAVGGLGDGVADGFERLGHQLAHGVVVFHQQQAGAGVGGGRQGVAGAGAGFGGGGAGQPDFHGGAAAGGALDAGAATGLDRHAVDLGQAQARALAHLFGGEKRFEHAAGDVGRHAAAAVAHGEADVVDLPAGVNV